MAKEVRPVVKNERVKDEFGNTQTCISNAVEGNRYVQCDLKRLPKLELNNQPTLFRMTFHELLFQAGLEKPISKDIPSDFRISSRLKLHLKKRQEWIVGETKEYPNENASEEKRVSLKYQTTLHFGIDYHASTTQLGFSKFLNSDSLLGLRFGARESNKENQTNVTFQYKRFTDNSFYFAPEIFYLNYTEKFSRSKDYEQTGMGLGIRLGNQWQWDNFTLGCDWVGIGRTMVYFKSTASDKNFYTVTLANVYLGWSF